jgi:hypothetical protein
LSNCKSRFFCLKSVFGFTTFICCFVLGFYIIMFFSLMYIICLWIKYYISPQGTSILILSEGNHLERILSFIEITTFFLSLAVIVGNKHGFWFHILVCFNYSFVPIAWFFLGDWGSSESLGLFLWLTAKKCSLQILICWILVMIGLLFDGEILDCSFKFSLYPSPGVGMILLFLKIWLLGSFHSFLLCIHGKWVTSLIILTFFLQSCHPKNYFLISEKIFSLKFHC